MRVYYVYLHFHGPKQVHCTIVFKRYTADKSFYYALYLKKQVKIFLDQEQLNLSSISVDKISKQTSFIRI